MAGGAQDVDYTEAPPVAGKTERKDSDMMSRAIWRRGFICGLITGALITAGLVAMLLEGS